jgi:acyl carrier protein
VTLTFFALGLDVVELVMGIEEAFDLTISDEEAAEVETVGLMYVFICDRLGLDPTAAESAPTVKGWTQGKVWDTLCAIIHHQLKVPKSEIHFDSRFVEDLGAD